MAYNAKLTSLNRGLTPIYPNQDRIHFAPQLAEDMHVLTGLRDDGTNKYLVFNKMYTDTPSLMTAADSDYPELAGTIWVVSDIDGWWNLSEPEIPNIQRGFGDGSFDVAGRFLARDVTFSGSVLIESGDRNVIAAKSKIVRETLLGAFNLVKRATWLIVDEDEYRRASYVRLSGRPQVSTVNSRGRIDFQIGLRAGDPLKYEWVEEIAAPAYEPETGNGWNLEYITRESILAYEDYYTATSTGGVVGGQLLLDVEHYSGYRTYGATVTSAESRSRSYPYQMGNFGTLEGSVDVVNNGNAEVPCYIRIVGPLYGPAVLVNQTNGQTMSIVAPPAGQSQLLGPTPEDSTREFIDIDTRNKAVHSGNYVTGEDDTVSMRGLFTPLTDWITLAPGTNTIYFADYGLPTVSEAPEIQIYWRSGWSE